MTKTHIICPQTSGPLGQTYSHFHQTWEPPSRDNQLSDNQVSDRHLAVVSFLDFSVLFLKCERLPHYSLKASDSAKAIFYINHCNANAAVYRLIFKRKSLLFTATANREEKLSSDDCSVWGHNKWKIYSLAQF